MSGIDLSGMVLVRQEELEDLVHKAKVLDDKCADLDKALGRNRDLFSKVEFLEGVYERTFGRKVVYQS